MNFEPQTYEELIRMKRCVELTKYYELTEGGIGGDLPFPGTKSRGFR